MSVTTTKLTKKQKAILDKELRNENEVVRVRTTNDFIDTEVKQYVHYVIRNRSTLHIMDGLRTGARKIIYGALNDVFKGSKKNALVKYTKLFAGAYDNAYDHGDASLKSTIEQFSSKHILKLSPFFTEGQLPYLRDNDIDVAPRYLEVKATNYLDLFRKDLDLLTYNFEENKFVEPKFFLPIIPMALIYRTSSPGFGYGYGGFSYNLYDIINAVNTVLTKGNCSGLNHVLIKPDIYEIDPNKIIYNTAKDCWYNIGDYKIEGDILRVTDLPYNITFKSYKSHLQTLVNKGIIKEFFDNSSSSIDFEIEFAPNTLPTHFQNKTKFFSMFKLIKQIPKNNYNFVDVSEKLITFDTPNEVVEYFVKTRLEFYELRRTKSIEEITKEIKFLNDMIAFIDAVINDKLTIFKRTRKQVNADIERLKLNKEGLNLRTTKYTTDGIREIKDEIKELEVNLKYLNNTTDKQMYLSDIVDLMTNYFRIDTVNKDLTVTKTLSEFDINDGYFNKGSVIKSKKRKSKKN